MKPLIAVPMGDAGGIGPEIVVKALGKKETFACADCVVVGDGKILENALRITESSLTVQKINHPREGRYEKDIINLIDLDNIDIDTWEIGKIQAQCGKAAFEYIQAAVAFALKGDVDAVATTPINKEALKKGSVDFIGHTEIFAYLTDTEDPLTMFEVKGLRVFFLSRHLSLMDAVHAISKERVMDYVVRCTQALRDLGVKDGTMAVAGLNPHSGENGLFGDEEVKYIRPAVEELKKMGYRVEGPVGADSVFHMALTGRYNSVLSLYHDQGHIATKTLDFDRTISITCGMPILRTSVDHGTAMDIAGKNLASSISMEEAIRLAAKYSPKFKH